MVNVGNFALKYLYGGKNMDLQKRSDTLNKAKKQLNDKSYADKVRKEGKSTAYDIMEMLFDEGTFVETNAYVKAYANELGTQNPDEYEGVVCGYGAIDGRLTFAYAQNCARLNGAFTKAAAEKIANVYEMALKNGAPIVSVFDSNGAKIEEGVDVLAGYGIVMKKCAKLCGKVPQISAICGNASGASATIASMADIVVMSQDATYSLNPVSSLVDSACDKEIGKSEYAFNKGQVDLVGKTTAETIELVKESLSYLPSNRLDKNVYTGTQDDPNRVTEEISVITAQENYDSHEVVASISDGGKYFELSAGKAKGLITAFTTINGIIAGIVANNPSHNDGKLSSGALCKAAGFVKLCDKFGISVVNLVDTAGYSAECEAHGGNVTKNSALLASAYCSASVPVVTVIVGKAYGSSFTVMGSKSLGADVVLALDSAKIGVLNPKASVSMMWTEKLIGSKAPIEKRKALEEEWETLMSTPLMAAYAGQVDDIIPSGETRMKIASCLEMLSMKSEFVNL